MTRKVFSNSEVAHVWAQNAHETGRSNNGQFYFCGPALFSYGTHYVLGFLMPDGVALMNDDSYSITTSRHQSHARGAVSHRRRLYIPDLTTLAPAMAWAARQQGEERPTGLAQFSIRDAKAARAAVRQWATDTLGGTRGRDPREIDGDALRYVLAAVGLSRSFGVIVRDAESRIAKRAAEEAAAKERAAEQSARLWGSKERAAALPDSLARIVAGERPHHARNWGGPVSYLESLNREALRAQKWAKGRPGFVRDHARIRAARAAIRAALAKREAIESRRLAWGNVKRALPLLRECLAALAMTADGGDVGATLRGKVADHERRGGEAAGLALLHDLAACEAMTQLSHVERAPTLTRATRAALAALRERLAPMARDAAERLADDLAAAAAKREAERIEREREKREAWQRGESVGYAYFRTARGGAYLRAKGVERDAAGQVTGGTLETSQGATVPLAHALRVFRFLKHCRDTGTPWARNGRTIRVGFYQVDSVEADGTFRAGCHLIEWSQVAALAESLGVSDLAPDSSVAESRGAA